MPARPFPVIEASAFLGELESGSSNPVLIRGIDPDGNEGDWITKCRSRLFRTDVGCQFEFFCSRLAEHFELATPEAAIINLSDEFVESLRFVNEDIYFQLKNNRGFNFGTRFLGPGFTTWPAGAKLPSNLIQGAAEILAFDVLIDNGNRVAENPNILVRGNELVVFDHELAFQFMGHSKSYGWRHAYYEKEDHPFFGSIRRKNVDLSRFGMRLAALDEAMVDSLRASVPARFQVVDLAQTRHWLLEIHREGSAFIRALAEGLP